MRVMLCTNSRDRGSTSRTMEAWAHLLPPHDVHPTVTVGGDGPLLSALRTAEVDVHIHPIREFFDARRPLPFLREVARLVWRIRRSRKLNVASATQAIANRKLMPTAKT